MPTAKESSRIPPCEYSDTVYQETERTLSRFPFVSRSTRDVALQRGCSRRRTSFGENAAVGDQSANKKEKGSRYFHDAPCSSTLCAIGEHKRRPVPEGCSGGASTF